MATCKHCGCFLPDEANICVSCGKPQDQERDQDNDESSEIMTNLIVKTNLLVMFETYMQQITNIDYKNNARKTIALAMKAIDAYPKNLDE